MSRTNRLFDERKRYGQIVTFQAPGEFKEAVDNALKLFSAGGLGEALAADWEETEKGFIEAVAELRAVAETPANAAALSKKEKKRFARAFQRFDSLLTQLKAFTVFDGKSIEDYGVTEKEYEEYYAHYCNIIEELREEKDSEGHEDEVPVNTDYEAQAFARVTIDYEYIISLIQNIVTPAEDETEEEYRARLKEVRGFVDDFIETNPKLGGMMKVILDGIEKDREAYAGKNISEILSGMKQEALEGIEDAFARKWHVNRSAVTYAAEHNVNGAVPNSSVLKESMRYSEYREAEEEPLPKYKARMQMVSELENIIREEIVPLLR